MVRPKLRPIIEIYEENASFWKNERRCSPFFEKKYMEWVLAQLSPNDTLLDLGCGSGYPISEYFLKRDIKITGVDSAHSMIEITKADFPEGQWLVADMRTLDLSQKFNAIIAWDSFFHLNFEEQIAMFPIFKKHLNPNGLLVFTSGPDRGEAIGDMNGNPLFHASLSAAEYRTLLKENNFEVVTYHPEDKECGGHTVWLCRQTT